MNRSQQHSSGCEGRGVSDQPKEKYTEHLTAHCGSFPREGTKGVSGENLLGFGGVKATGSRKEDHF